MRGYVDAGNSVLSHVNYTPIGMPDSSITGPAFTGEWRDATGVQYHRARYLSPRIGTFLSRDPVEGTVTRPMSLNGYSWVEGDVVNAVDPSGLCWDHPMTSDDQQTQCLSAWNAYLSRVDLNDPQLRALVRQEDAYWGGLSYGEFINLWNDNRRRPPASVTPNNAGNIAAGTVALAGGVSIANPLPGPEDIGAGAILIGGLCLAAFAALAGAVGIGTIALPQRQSVGFSMSRVEGTAVPIPLPRDIPVYPTATPENNDEDYYFRGTTIGFAGSLALQRIGVTPTTTQPGVATVFAIVAETEYGGSGVVYIASSSDLDSISTLPSNVLSSYEFEVAFDMLLLEFAALASDSVSATGARTILANMGVVIASRISLGEQSDLLQSLVPLSKSQIRHFVKQARITP